MTAALQGQCLAALVPAHLPPCAWACHVPAHRRVPWRLPYTDGHLGGDARGLASIPTRGIFVHRVGQPSIGGKLSPL
uniref:Secreted protein n=1 Tax=Rhinopithecus bieti TaxID=61621 RepID=A0A2K6M1E9_RHIBE